MIHDFGRFFSEVAIRDRSAQVGSRSGDDRADRGVLPIGRGTRARGAAAR
jgi:hypothetical protein